MGGTSQLADELLAHHGPWSIDLFTLKLFVPDKKVAVETKVLWNVMAVWLLQIAMYLSIQVRYTVKMENELTRIKKKQLLDNKGIILVI